MRRWGGPKRLEIEDRLRGFEQRQEERNKRRQAALEARNRLFPIWSLPGRQLANCKRDTGRGLVEGLR